MKSYTASTQVGLVRVQLPDQGEPRVVQGGRVVAHGQPQVVPLGTVDGGMLICPPQTPWHGTIAPRIVGGSLGAGAGLEATDVPCAHTTGHFVAEGFPPLFGARINDRDRTVSGFDFTDGQTLVTWQAQLPKVTKPCCGKRAVETPVEVDLYVLAWPL